MRFEAAQVFGRSALEEAIAGVHRDDPMLYRFEQSNRIVPRDDRI
jgi:hypothetical protein